MHVHHNPTPPPSWEDPRSVTGSAVSIMVFSSMKILFSHEIASLPIFFHLNLNWTNSQLYLFSSMKIPRTQMKSLHFWFLHLIGCKIASFPIFSTLTLTGLIVSFTYFHRWKYQEHAQNRFISVFFVLLGVRLGFFIWLGLAVLLLD